MAVLPLSSRIYNYSLPDSLILCENRVVTIISVRGFDASIHSSMSNIQESASKLWLWISIHSNAPN